MVHTDPDGLEVLAEQASGGPHIDADGPHDWSGHVPIPDAPEGLRGFDGAEAPTVGPASDTGSIPVRSTRTRLADRLVVVAQVFAGLGMTLGALGALLGGER